MIYKWSSKNLHVNVDDFQVRTDCRRIDCAFYIPMSFPCQSHWRLTAVYHLALLRRISFWTHAPGFESTLTVQLLLRTERDCVRSVCIVLHELTWQLNSIHTKPVRVYRQLFWLLLETLAADLACMMHYCVLHTQPLKRFVFSISVCGPATNVKINDLHEAVRVTGLMTDANI